MTELDNKLEQLETKLKILPELKKVVENSYTQVGQKMDTHSSLIKCNEQDIKKILDRLNRLESQQEQSNDSKMTEIIKYYKYSIMLFALSAIILLISIFI